MSHSMQKMYTIYNDEEGTFFQVGPSPDAPDDLLYIRTQGEDNETWYGKMNFSLTKEEAKLLAIALNDLAGELK